MLSSLKQLNIKPIIGLFYLIETYDLRSTKAIFGFVFKSNFIFNPLAVRQFKDNLNGCDTIEVGSMPHKKAIEPSKHAYNTPSR